MRWIIGAATVMGIVLIAGAHQRPAQLQPEYSCDHVLVCDGGGDHFRFFKQNTD